jgi:hypothetical protein
MSLINEYARTLSQLTGDDFQEEVCTRLQTVILSFQTIPPKPQGDAGLDGISHDGEHRYCCYGPEHDEFKKPKGTDKWIGAWKWFRIKEGSKRARSSGG